MKEKEDLEEHAEIGALRHCSISSMSKNFILGLRGTLDAELFYKGRLGAVVTNLVNGEFFVGNGGVEASGERNSCDKVGWVLHFGGRLFG